MPKTFYLIIFPYFLFIINSFSGNYQYNKIDPNPSFKKLLSKVDKIVIKDLGVKNDELKNICYVKEITDYKEIEKFKANIKFKIGTHSNNCFCSGMPKFYFYVSEKIIMVAGFKHGFGLERNGKVAFFTDKSGKWINNLLLNYGFNKKYLNKKYMVIPFIANCRKDCRNKNEKMSNSIDLMHMNFSNY